MKKRISALIITAMALTTLTACKSKDVLKVENLNTIHEEEFGGVYLQMEIEEFNSKGFNYGDSVKVEFSNGYVIEDLPYYNGYYVDAGESLLVGYPGYDYIKVAINYGDDYWNIIDLNEGDTATITLNEEAKYKDIQDTMNIQYLDERVKYDSDEIFANYREINVGDIKDNILYRSASPCDNKHKRAPYVDKLMEQDQIQFIMNLADTKEKIDSYIAQSDFDSPYFLSLYQKNTLFLTSTGNEQVLPLAMNMNYKSDEFRGKVAQGFKQFLNYDGPYLIHCQEGKDRTGFVCIVIEALLNATYTEIVDDYMETYDNYYKITLERDSLRYNVIKTRNVDSMLKFLVGDDNIDITNVNFSSYIRNYLINGGMTDEEVTSLITLLSN